MSVFGSRCTPSVVYFVVSACADLYLLISHFPFSRLEPGVFIF